MRRDVPDLQFTAPRERTREEESGGMDKRGGRGREWEREGKRNGGKKGKRQSVADNTKSSMIPMTEKNPTLQKEEVEKKTQNTARL